MPLQGKAPSVERAANPLEKEETNSPEPIGQNQNQLKKCPFLNLQGHHNDTSQYGKIKIILAVLSDSVSPTRNTNILGLELVYTLEYLKNITINNTVLSDHIVVEISPDDDSLRRNTVHNMIYSKNVNFCQLNFYSAEIISQIYTKQ